MPNRILSGEIARSESLSRVSVEASFTFLLIVSVADDFGRFDGRPSILLSSLFPTRMDTVSMEVMNRWLRELEGEGLIRWYEVEGRRYIEIPRWEKYQRTRAQRSKYPAPLTKPESVSDMQADDSDPLSDDGESLSNVAGLTYSETIYVDEKKKTPTARPKASLPAWALRCSRLLIDLLEPVPGARIPPGSEARWARELVALAREVPELSNGKPPDQHIEAAIRWALGPENLGREYEVVIRSGKALREKWPQLVAAARRRAHSPAGKQEEFDRWVKQQQSSASA